MMKIIIIIIKIRTDELIIIIIVVVISGSAYAQKYQKDRDKVMFDMASTYPNGSYSFSEKDSCLTYVTNQDGAVWTCFFKNNKNYMSYYVSLQDNGVTLQLWKSFLDDPDFNIKDDLKTIESYYCVAKFGLTDKKSDLTDKKLAFIEFDYK